MSTLEDLEDLEREEQEKKKDDKDKDGKKPEQNGDAEMKDAEDAKEEEKEDELDAEILHSSTRDIQMRKRLLDNDMRIMKSEYQRLTHEQAAMKEKIKDNLDKIENNRFVIFELFNRAPLTVLQTATISRWKRCRASRSRRRS
jgi:26S proteasome regulatory subunit T5